jgi:hypothetical protein
VLIAINGASKLSIFVLRAARDQINLDDFGDDDFDQ